MTILNHIREKYIQTIERHGLGLMIGIEFRDAKHKPKRTVKEDE